MEQHEIKTAWTLAALGVLPFWLLPLIELMFEPSLPWSLTAISLVYSAVIISFIAGTHWGVCLMRNVKLDLFIKSNVITLIAWASVFLMPMVALIIMAACFIYLLMIDKRLYDDLIIDDWYFALRKRITTTVIASFPLAMVAY